MGIFDRANNIDKMKEQQERLQEQIKRKIQEQKEQTKKELEKKQKIADEKYKIERLKKRIEETPQETPETKPEETGYVELGEPNVAITPRKLWGLLGKGKIIRQPEDKEPKELKTPLAFIINDKQEIEIRENVPEGRMLYNRRNGDRDEEVEILTPKSKLLSFPNGGKSIPVWIVDVKEAVALPTRVLHDSLELKRIMGALILNYESMKLNGSNMKWLLYIILGIVGIVVATAMFGGGKSFLEIIGAVQPATTTIIQPTIDANTAHMQAIAGTIKGWLL